MGADSSGRHPTHCEIYPACIYMALVLRLHPHQHLGLRTNDKIHHEFQVLFRVSRPQLHIFMAQELYLYVFCL